MRRIMKPNRFKFNLVYGEFYIIYMGLISVWEKWAKWVHFCQVFKPVWDFTYTRFHLKR